MARSKSLAAAANAVDSRLTRSCLVLTAFRDGRTLEAAREAERQGDAVRELRMAEIEASQIGGYVSTPFWFITGGVAPCRYGEPCGHDFRFSGLRPRGGAAVVRGGHLVKPVHPEVLGKLLERVVTVR